MAAWLTSRAPLSLCSLHAKQLDLHVTVFHEGRQEGRMRECVQAWEEAGSAQRKTRWAKMKMNAPFCSVWVSFHSVTETRVKSLSGS